MVSRFLRFSARRILRSRFARYGLVGMMGMLVNLGVLAFLVRTCGLLDWRSSVIASLFSMLHNYVWNNCWTFSEYGRKGKGLALGFFSYAGACLLGMTLSTVLYSSLAKLVVFRHDLSPRLTLLTLLFIQFCSVSVGAYLNYRINRKITWPESDDAIGHVHSPSQALLGSIR